MENDDEELKYEDVLIAHTSLIQALAMTLRASGQLPDQHLQRFLIHSGRVLESRPGAHRFYLQMQSDLEELLEAVDKTPS